MKFIELETPFGNVLVVPDHVSWIQLTGTNVSKVGFLGGSEISPVSGKPHEIAEKLHSAAPQGAAPGAEEPAS